MKRILSLILVLLLSFSLCCVCASADDTVSGDSAGSGQGAAPAGSTASAGQAEDAAPGYEIYDTSLFCDRIKDAFEKCHHDQKTLKILRKANWNKTDDMLRSELAACFRQYEQLKAEIENLIPDELKEYFHGQSSIIPGNYKDIFDDFVQNRLKLYNEKVEAILGVQGEMIDLYLELYNRGINTADQITNSINQIFESGATAAANALGIQLTTDGTYIPQEDKKQSVSISAPSSGMVWIPENGNHYHDIPNCGNMNPKTAKQVTLEWAKLNNYQWCEDCHPPK